MIRYDPTQIEHKAYEIQPNQKETKKVKKSQVQKAVEEAPVQTSNEIYYQVSNKFSGSMGGMEEFSLLKLHGRESVQQSKINEPPPQLPTASVEKKKSFLPNLNRKNPFKYDSTDDEDETEKLKPNKRSSTNTLFFDTESWSFAGTFDTISAIMHLEQNNLIFRYQKIFPIGSVEVDRRISKTQTGIEKNCKI